METLALATAQRSQMLDITRQVQAVVTRAAVKDGQVTIFVPHTTAGLTINENADPDVVHDLLAQLDQMVPWTQPHYQHSEGNSAAHLKASLMGFSVTVLIAAGRLALGTWQGIYLCEFDGPRQRQVWVRVAS